MASVPKPATALKGAVLLTAVSVAAGPLGWPAAAFAGSTARPISSS
jgi:hypothetical protein